MTETNTLTEAMETVVNSLLEDVHTSLPGRIESYNFSEQRATVKPLIKKKYLDGEVLELPVLVNVPIVFPRTKTVGITFPVKKGDGVLLHFSERALERWKSTGNDSEPGDRRKFDMSDAIGVIGCYSFADKNLAANNDDVQIHNTGQTITIKKNGDIEVGNTSLKKLITEEFKSIYEGHHHIFWDSIAAKVVKTSGPGQLTGTIPITPPIAPVPDVPPSLNSEITNNELTSKVKAQ